MKEVDMKRRLPEWMLCMHAADHGKKKSDTRDSNSCGNAEDVELKKKSETKDVKDDGRVKKKSRMKDASNGESAKGVKKRSKTEYVKCGEDLDAKAEKEDVNKFTRQTKPKHKRARCSIEDPKEDSCFLVRCEATPRNRRKLSLEDKSCDYESGFETRKQSRVAKNIDEAELALKRQKAKARSSPIEIADENGDNEDLMSIGKEYASEDEDLTVDDLLTIARECVNEEGNAEQNMLSTKESTAAIQHRDTDVSASSVVGTKEASCAYGGISAEDTSSSDALHKPNITGSLTEDMLDLFLGPLLKKNRDEKDVELVRDDDIKFAYECDLESRNRRVENPAPLAKRKGSLKDRVALFF